MGDTEGFRSHTQKTITLVRGHNNQPFSLYFSGTLKLFLNMQSVFLPTFPTYALVVGVRIVKFSR